MDQEISKPPITNGTQPENTTPSADQPSQPPKRSFPKKTIIIAVVILIAATFLGLFVLGSRKNSPANNTATPSPTAVATLIPTPTPTEMPSPFPTITYSPKATPTPTIPPFSIQTIEPIYLPQDYSSNNKIKIKGSGFQSGATVTIQGPYELTGEKTGSFNDYPVQSVIVTPPNFIDGVIASGLPAGYFKIIVKNPDGSTTSTSYSLLHQGVGSPP